MVAANRLGWALIATASAIGAFGMIVYVRNPTTPLQPMRVKASIAGGATSFKASNAGAVAVLNDFIEALERNDTHAMQKAFPGITKRERRILHGIRRRLGEASDLVVSSERVRRESAGAIELDFIVICTQAGKNSQLRLPFTATTRMQDGEWKIVDLR